MTTEEHRDLSRPKIEARPLDLAAIRAHAAAARRHWPDPDTLPLREWMIDYLLRKLDEALAENAALHKAVAESEADRE